MTKLILIPIISYFIFFQTTINAQGYGTLRGFVTDSTNGEALAYGNVYIEDLKIGASTDEMGMYIINKIPLSRKFDVTFSYVGYKPKKLSIFLTNSDLFQLDAALIPLKIELQTIEKIGEKVIEKNETNISVEKIPIKQLEVLPSSVETDIFKYLQNTSGVNTTGDVTAKFYVRGGNSDQNLFLINGIPIYTPYHSLGLFSAIDPAIINSAEFLKGAFDSEYGGRLSSVMNIISKDGNKNRFGLTAAMSSLTLKGLFEGPIPNGSFLISGRKSYSTAILNKFLQEGSVPIDFYDLSFKLNYSSKELFNNAKFSVFVFSSSDAVDYKDPLREKFKWKNNLFGFEWLQIYDIPLFSRIGISISKFEGEVIPNESSLKPQKNEVNDADLSFDMNVVYSNKNELGGGFKFKFLKTKFYQENLVGAKTNLEQFGGNITLYGKYKLLQFDDFGADIGARVNLAGLNGNGGGTIEPRVKLTYRLFQDLSLKGAWGIFTQEVTTLTDEDELLSVFDPWIIIPANMNPSRSVQYNIGVTYEVASISSLSFEGFYKITHDLPIINSQKYLSSDPDLIAGSAESYGYEFNSKSNVGPIDLSLSYTLNFAYKESNGWLYYPKYDTRHTVNFILNLNIGSGWNFGAIWNYSSGLPFTQISGYYDKFYLNNIYGTGDNFGVYTPYSVLDDRNLGRLPDYHRLDLSLTKQFEILFSGWQFSISAVNVYNRKNVYYLDRKTGKIVYMLPFFVSGTIKVML